MPPTTCGFSTIELLIAFSVGISILTASMMLIFTDAQLRGQLSLNTNQSATLNTLRGSAGHRVNYGYLQTIRELLKQNWHHTFATTSSHFDGYESEPPTIVDISPCLKEVSVATRWATNSLLPQYAELSTAINHLDTLVALGGDCDTLPSHSTWNTPEVSTTFATTTGSFNALDVLDGTVYTSDNSGTIYIISPDDSTGTLETIGIFNTTTPINDIDAAVWINPLTRELRRYVYLMRHDSSAQLQIIDVTDPSSPSSLPSMTKRFTGGTPPGGSFPQGWRIRYFDNMVYALTRETAGYEFHIFDVTDPTTPQEVGPGLEITGTVNDMRVVGVDIDGIQHRLVYLVTERSTREIMVIDVTNPFTPSLLTSFDLPTNLDALSLEVLGNTMYVGRQQYTGGPELTIFSIKYSTTTPLVMTLTPYSHGADTGGSVTNLQASGNTLFAVIAQASNSLQVWDISSPTTGLVRRNPAFGANNRITGEIDYDNLHIFATGQLHNSLQKIITTP